MSATTAAPSVAGSVGVTPNNRSVIRRVAATAPTSPRITDNDWMLVTFAAMLVAPWTALASIVRQKEALARIGRHAHLVFITAYDHYAVQAFAQGARDYLLKPVEPARLAETVSRLRERLQSSRPAINTDQLLQQLSEQLAKLQSGGAKHEALRWIRAQAGKTLRLIAIDDVDYLRADAKYTVVAWRDGGKPAEAVVRTPLKELLEQLDSDQFAQVHRSVIVNLRAISHVKRHDNETAEIHLKGRDAVLPVSRNYLHLFRQM